MLYISRAALQVTNEDEGTNKNRLKIVLETFCQKNKISFSHFRAIIFSQTNDINFFNPATCIRLLHLADHIALFCTKEPDYPHSIPLTVRMIIFFSHIFPWKKVSPVYMFGAEILRPDIQ